MSQWVRKLVTSENARNLIGRRVQARRLILNLRQDELAARIATLTGAVWNPNYQEISRLESGFRQVTDIEALVMSVALDADVTWLLTGSEERASEATLRKLLRERQDDVAAGQVDGNAKDASEGTNLRRRGSRRPR
ncbi:MAG: hypothetical protein H8F28_25720 [Fibrella sp.]|nr:hypothetical protein [Armatimonadota bacterium]